MSDEDELDEDEDELDEDEDTFTVDLTFLRPPVAPLTSPPDWSSTELVEWTNEVRRLEEEGRKNNFRTFGMGRRRRELDEDELNEDELDEDEDRGELLTRWLEEVERNDRYIAGFVAAEAERHDPGMGANSEPVLRNWHPGELMRHSGELIRGWFGDTELLHRWLQKDERHARWLLEADRYIEGLDAAEADRKEWGWENGEPL